MPPKPKKFREDLVPLGDRHRSILRWRLYQRDIDAQEAVQVSRFSLAQVITRWQFELALEWTVINLHYQETALGGAAAIRSVAADAEAVAFHSDFQMFAAHSG